MDSQEWDARYAAAPAMWGSQPNRTVTEQLGGLAPGTAVDLACGDGRHAAWLAGLGWRVYAVDFSATAIEQARLRPDTAHERITWVVGDARTWSPPEPVDVMLVAYLHLTDLAAVLARAMADVAPGGRLVYVGHALENLEHGVGGPQEPGVLPSVEALAVAASGARVERLQHLTRETPAGDAVDVLLVARPWGA